MKKIPTIFQRDWDGDRSRVLDIPHPDCAWVFAGEGVATIKLDGTSCLYHEGKLWKRREVKKGQPAPFAFMVADTDEETGKTVGWVPVGDGPEDQFHRAALGVTAPYRLIEGSTFELVGPKIQGGVERQYTISWLVAHDEAPLLKDAPRTFDGLRIWLDGKDIEGIVFHHPDGRMAKIKLRDFGLKRRTAA